VVGGLGAGVVGCVRGVVTLGGAVVGVSTTVTGGLLVPLFVQKELATTCQSAIMVPLSMPSYPKSSTKASIEISK
jgi:hypothetical protein